MNLHGYQVDIWGLNCSLMAYLPKIRDFSSFQVNLIININIISPFKSIRFHLNDYIDCFRMTLMMNSHGYLVDFRCM